MKKRVIQITRQMAHVMLDQATALLVASQGGTVLNRAFIERFNGTMRERLANLTRKCRHAAPRLVALHTGMHLVGCTYNFCWPHHQLSRTTIEEATGQRSLVACTPAMAGGLTDHALKAFELLSYKMAPSPWVILKRRGRPRKPPLVDSILPKPPPGHPRKVAA